MVQHEGLVDRGHRARAVTVGVVGTFTVLGGAWLAWHGFAAELHRLEDRSALRTLDAVPVLLWAALVLALLWAALLITLATLSVLRDTGGAGGDRDPGSHGPAGLVGRLAGILLAVSALSALSATTPAFATTAPVSVAAGGHVVPAATGAPHGIGQDAEPVANTSDPCAPDVPTPGWVPDRPARTDQVARDCAPLVTGKPVADDSGEVVVHRGDTLWSIAAAHLGPHADARAIAAEWPRWYAANRAVIGDNPDLLFIGTRLQSPDHVLEGSAQ